MRSTARRRSLSALIATIVIGAGTAQAQNIWSGTDALWATSANWSTMAAPIAGDNVQFPFTIPSGGSNITVPAGALANSLNFKNSYILTGGDITLTTNAISVDGGFTADIGTDLKGTVGLALTGGGTLVLNPGNTFTGNITASGSGTTLSFAGAGGDPSALGAAGGRSITLSNGATLAVTGTTAFNPAANTKSISIGTGGGTINTNTATVTLDDGGQFGGSGDLTKTGAGTLTIDNQGFGYTGSTINVNEGTLRALRNVGVLGTGTVAINVASGATFEISAAFSGTKNVSIAGTGVGSVGALNASGAGAISGTTTLTADSSLGGAGTLTLTGVVSGAFNLTKVGTGTTIFSNAGNTYSGNTIITGGAIRGTAGTSLPTTGNLSLNGGAFETVASYNGTLGTAAGQVQLPGGASGFSSGNAAGVTVSLNGGTELTWGSGDFAPSALVLSAGSALGALDFQNPLALGATNRTITTNAAASSTTVATLSGIISGTNGLTKTGTGVLELSNSGNTYSGTTTVSGGVLRGVIGAGIKGNVTLNGGSYESDSNIEMDLGTAIGEVQLTGGASGFSAITIPINVNLGGASAAVVWGGTFNPSTLVVNATSSTSTLNFQNPIDLNGATRTFAGNGTGTNLGTISGSIGTSSGTAGITINGTGTLVLSGNNTYNGTTTLTAGTLSVSDVTNLGDAAAPLTFGGGTLLVTGTTMNNLGTRTVVYGTAPSINIADPAGNLTLPTTPALASGTLNKNGPGTLTMGAATNVVTQLNVTGVIDLGNTELQVNNGGSTTIRTVNGSGTINASGTGKIRLTASDGDAGAANGQTLTINAPITGAFRYENFVGNNGTGVTVLNSLTSDFSGGVQVNSSVLSVPQIGNTGSVGPVGTGSTIRISAGTFRYTGPGETNDRIIEIGNTTGFLDSSGGTASTPLKFTSNFTVTNTAAKTFTLTGTGFGEIAGSIPNNTAATSINKTGTGTWALSGANTYSGTTTLTAGTLSVSSIGNVGTSTVAFNGGTLQVTGTSLTSLSPRTITVAANATAGFDIADATHTFQMTGVPALVLNQKLLKTGPGTLELNLSGSVQNLFVDGGVLDLMDKTLTVNGGGGNTILARGTGTINATGGGAISLPVGGTNFGDNSANTGEVLTINAKVTGAGGFEYYGGTTGTGWGTIVLANPANDYTTGTTINSGGTISVPAIGMTGSPSPVGTGSTIGFVNGTTGTARLLYTGAGETTDRILSFGNTNATIDASGTGLITFTANLAMPGTNDKTITLAGTGSGELAGVISNNSGANTTRINKTGTGTWILSGANTYTDPTTISAGILVVNGSTNVASAFTVQSGATLSGSGTINGAVTFDAGSDLAPGTSPGTLSTGALTLNALTELKYELDTPGTVGMGVNDLTNVTGNLTLAGELDIIALGGFGVGSYRLFNYTGALTDNGLTLGDAPLGYSYAFDTANTGEVNLLVTAIPEPSTFVLGALGLLGVAGFRLRRRRMA